MNAGSLLWGCSLYVGDWKQVSQHWFCKGGYRLPAVVNYKERQVRKEKAQMRNLRIITSTIQVLSDSNGKGNQNTRGSNISSRESSWEGCDSTEAETWTQMYLSCYKSIHLFHWQKLGQVDVIFQCTGINLQICKIMQWRQAATHRYLLALSFFSGGALIFSWTLGYGKQRFSLVAKVCLSQQYIKRGAVCNFQDLFLN